MVGDDREVLPDVRIPPEVADREDVHATSAWQQPVHYTRYIESLLDFYHVPVVHRDHWFNVLDYVGWSGTPKKLGLDGRRRYLAMTKVEDSRLEVDGTTLRHTFRLVGEGDPTNVAPMSVTFTFPGMVHIHTEPFDVTIWMTPVDDEHTQVLFRWYEDKHLAPLLRAPSLRRVLPKLALFAQKRVQEVQDMNIVTRIEPRVTGRGVNRFVAVDELNAKYVVMRDQLRKEAGLVGEGAVGEGAADDGAVDDGADPEKLAALNGRPRRTRRRCDGSRARTHRDRRHRVPLPGVRGAGALDATRVKARPRRVPSGAGRGGRRRRPLRHPAGAAAVDDPHAGPHAGGGPAVPHRRRIHRAPARHRPHRRHRRDLLRPRPPVRQRAPRRGRAVRPRPRTGGAGPARRARPAGAARAAEEVRAGLAERFGASPHDRVGEMASTIPARIAGAFRLRGRTLTVESADATSFAALAHAVNGLRGDLCDAVLVLAGQRRESPLFGELLAAKGLPADPGEGVGALLLKRRSSAVRDGDRIYASILECALEHDARPGCCGTRRPSNGGTAWPAPATRRRACRPGWSDTWNARSAGRLRRRTPSRPRWVAVRGRPARVGGPRRARGRAGPNLRRCRARRRREDRARPLPPQAAAARGGISRRAFPLRPDGRGLVSRRSRAEPPSSGPR